MPAIRAARRLKSAFAEFLEDQSAGGLLLMGAAAIALVAANSPLAGAYAELLHFKAAGLSLHHWINDGLMALFFLLVGLEIKRELIDGQLSSWSARVLPGLSAIGGMAVPALIYAAFNFSDPAALRGWAIPAATDIAFALAVLTLLGPRVPMSLKVFLTALAILDDLGAVLIIALFYTGDLQLWALAGAGGCLAALIVLNRMKVGRLSPYLLIGAVLWWFTLKSGVHATLAGVALALTIPLGRSRDGAEDDHSPLHRLEHGLAPWVGFLVVPVFGFANAGLPLTGLSPAAVFQPIPLGVAAGLLVGKQLGVFLPAFAAIKLGWARPPEEAGLRHLYGVALICGIGFTMSLFIGALAFEDAASQDAARLGVLAGSLLSGLAGWLWLRLIPAPSAKTRTP